MDTAPNEKSIPQFTKAPWGWMNLGGKWQLFGLHGKRPVVLSLLRIRQRSTSETVFAVNVDGILEELTPDHPDAQLIAAAPDLYAALNALVAFHTMPIQDFATRYGWHGNPAEVEERLLRNAQNALAKVRGEGAHPE